jgi:hypothetical protein
MGFGYRSPLQVTGQLACLVVGFAVVGFANPTLVFPSDKLGGASTLGSWVPKTIPPLNLTIQRQRKEANRLVIGR